MLSARWNVAPPPPPAAGMSEPAICPQGLPAESLVFHDMTRVELEAAWSEPAAFRFALYWCQSIVCPVPGVRVSLFVIAIVASITRSPDAVLTVIEGAAGLTPLTVCAALRQTVV